MLALEPPLRQVEMAVLAVAAMEAVVVAGPDPTRDFSSAAAVVVGLAALVAPACLTGRPCHKAPDMPQKRTQATAAMVLAAEVAPQPPPANLEW